MSRATEHLLVPVPGGQLDCAVDRPAGDVRGVAIVAHPHPLHGGARDNKVVQTVARALVSQGYVTWRPNFRGVGASTGTFNDGIGETDDLLALVDFAAARQRAEQAPERWVLAGFSFGSFVIARVAERLPELMKATDDRAPARLILIGTAASRWQVPAVPPGTLVIHGETDDVVPLSAVFDWARPQSLPVVVCPGAGHFFHGELITLKSLVLGSLGPPASG